MTPTVDKGKNQIAPDEYHVMEVNLGRASREKILEEFDDPTQALKDRLKKVEEGYEKQKREIWALCQYINNLPHPVREEGPSFVPPAGVSSEVVGDIDKIKQIAQGAKIWIEGI